MHFLKFLFLVNFLALALANSPMQCPCTKEYKPECGEDGATYPNKCERECQRVKKVKDGPCEDDGGITGDNGAGQNGGKKGCVCTMEYKPECGTDAKTYPNKCERECQGVEKHSDGPCKIVSGGGAKAGKKNCVCPMDYMPECGFDGQTYPNKCKRECQGVKKAKDGECDGMTGGNKPNDCVCTKEYHPECGADLQTYPNKCERECQGVELYYDGACKGEKKDCVCTMESKPECGADLQTYPNKCERECQGVKKKHDGPCKPVNGVGHKAGKKNCVCTKEYKPECGFDGQTYPNKCERECQGVKKAKDGECDGMTGGNKPNDCVCTKEYHPECGADLQTYPNKCERECQGVELYYDGACKGEKKDCVCTLESKPECGADLQTYPNKCERECQGVKKKHDGACKPVNGVGHKAGKKDCVCTMEYMPECGFDGQTYSNKCGRECQGVKKAKDGECDGMAGGNKKKDCVCTKEYHPECGKDGQTYPNKCERECQGVQKAKDGACPGGSAGGDNFGKKKVCACPKIHQPECGADLQTYPNKCERECQGVKKQYDGPCKPVNGGGAKPGKKGCVCTLEYKPECGTDAQTYPNKCERECQGVKKYSDGPCKPVNGGGAKAAQKNCPCPLILKPECGTDGQTYDNACLRKCAGVEKASDGACAGGGITLYGQPSGACACTKELQPECGVDGETYNNKCLRKCKSVPKAYNGPCAVHDGPGQRPDGTPCTCPKHMKPECGTDGKTYNNDCLRNCAGVPKASDGPCGMTGGNGVSQYGKRKDCVCTMDYKPECGTDAQTYPNKCERECQGVTKYSDGPCKPVNGGGAKAGKKGCVCTMEYKPECGTDAQTYPNKCERECQGVAKYSDGPCKPVNGGGAKAGKKGCVCPLILKPECGMDGQTYDNACLRKCEGVEKSKDGKCDGITGGNQFKPNDCVCTKEYHPECGKDGQTYANKCERKCQGVEKAKDGPCAGGAAGGDNFGKKKVCQCPKIYQPECGDDLQTYPNKCERECQGVGKHYDGPCKPVNGAGAKPGKKGCVCTMEYKPECGGNYQTYPNKCERECDGVSKSYDGPCKPLDGGGAKPGKKGCVCTMEYKPECGTDAKTYPNKCERECQGVEKYSDGPCTIVSGGVGKAGKKACACTKEYKPECGTDAKTYPNKCERECQGVEKYSDGPCTIVSGGGAKAGKKACACTKEYLPECGKDGQTYPNKCERECQGVAKASDGQCSSPAGGANRKACLAVVEPECGMDGNTYNNACERENAGVQKQSDGECQGFSGDNAAGTKPNNQLCFVEEPECGVDGKTYKNACEREQAGVEKQADGPCTF